MSFTQAVSDGFAKYATFSGRSRRSAYWYWILFTILVYVVAAVLDSVIGLKVQDNVPYGWITLVAALVLLIPGIAVTIRRLHDSGRSGWWWVLSLVCGIGGIIVLVFCLIDSTPGANAYGPNPKGA